MVWSSLERAHSLIAHRRLDTSGSLQDLVLDHPGKNLHVSSTAGEINEQLYISSDGSVLIVDRATRKLICRYPVKGTPRRIAFSLAGDRAYITNEWNWPRIVE